MNMKFLCFGKVLCTNFPLTLEEDESIQTLAAIYVKEQAKISL